MKKRDRLPDALGEFADQIYGQQKALMVHESGAVQIGAFTLYPTGLTIDGEISRDDWERMLSLVLRIKGALQWMIGDLLAYGVERQWGITYEHFSELTGYAVETLRNLVWVCSNIRLSSRRDNLSFKHHYLVAALPPEEHDRWLSQATAGRWSARRLAEEMGIQPSPTPSQSAFEQAVQSSLRVIEKITIGQVEDLNITTAQHLLAHIESVRRYLDHLEAALHKRLD